MKDIRDVLLMLLIASIVWGIVFLILAILTFNAINPDTAATISIILASVVAVGFFALWIKGRSISKSESRAESHQLASDFVVIRAYCGLFEELDTSKYIYDLSLLPYSKERILSAAIRILDRKDSPEMMKAGAALVTELSQFQDNVGSTPQPTLMSVMLDPPNPTEGTDEVDQLARAIADHKKSHYEIRAELEREKILLLLDNLIGKAS